MQNKQAFVPGPSSTGKKKKRPGEQLSRLMAPPVFPTGSLLAGGAALGGGLAAMGAGRQLDRFANLSFKDLEGISQSASGLRSPGDIPKDLAEQAQGFASRFKWNIPATWNPATVPTANKQLHADVPQTRTGPLGMFLHDPSIPAAYQSKYNENFSKSPAAPGVPDPLDSRPDAKLKDYSADWSKSNIGIRQTLTARDLPEAMLGYTNAGHAMLGSPAYGKENAVKVMGWLRSPANKWWFIDKLFPGGRYWGQGSLLPNDKRVPSTFDNPGGTEQHYGAFAASAPSAYHQLLKEYTGSTHEAMQQLSDARVKALRRLVGGEIEAHQIPETVAQTIAGSSRYTPPVFSSFNDIAPKDDEAGELSGIAKTTLLGQTAAPLSKIPVLNSFRYLANHLEQNLPERNKLTPEIVARLRKNPQELTGLLTGPYSESQDEGAGHFAAVRHAFGMLSPKDYGKNETENSSLLKAKLDALHGKMETAYNANLADGSPPPGGTASPGSSLASRLEDFRKDEGTRRSLQAYDAIKDKPEAHLAATGGMGGSPHFPVSALLYRAIGETMSMPGRAAQAASKLSPALRYGGAALATAGAGVGAYKLYDWWKKRQAAQKIREEVEALQESKHKKAANMQKDAILIPALLGAGASKIHQSFGGKSDARRWATRGVGLDLGVGLGGGAGATVGSLLGAGGGAGLGALATLLGGGSPRENMIGGAGLGAAAGGAVGGLGGAYLGGRAGYDLSGDVADKYFPEEKEPKEKHTEKGELKHKKAANMRKQAEEEALDPEFWQKHKDPSGELVLRQQANVPEPAPAELYPSPGQAMPPRHHNLNMDGTANIAAPAGDYSQLYGSLGAGGLGALAAGGGLLRRGIVGGATGLGAYGGSELGKTHIGGEHGGLIGGALGALAGHMGGRMIAPEEEEEKHKMASDNPLQTKIASFLVQRAVRQHTIAQLNKLASQLPIEKQAGVRHLQIELSRGSTLPVAIKKAYTKLSSMEQVTLFAKLSKELS